MFTWPASKVIETGGSAGSRRHVEEVFVCENELNRYDHNVSIQHVKIRHLHTDIHTQSHRDRQSHTQRDRDRQSITESHKHTKTTDSRPLVYTR